MVHNVGVTVIAITFDGNSNVSTVNALGTDMKCDENFQTSFPHPCTSEPIYTLLDMCHMLKLVHNILAAKHTLRTPSGLVEWKYLVMLNNLQNMTGYKIAEKLSDRHINFENEKMRVDLAAQTLSASVSNALLSLQNSHDDFRECSETAKFIGVFNILFDMFNSKNTNAPGYKAPMNTENFPSYNYILEDLETYVRGLYIQQEKSGQLSWVPVTQTVNKTGFVGFLTAIKSFTSIYRQYVEDTKELENIKCYYFSQDHLEMFFLPFDQGVEITTIQRRLNLRPHTRD